MELPSVVTSTLVVVLLFLGPIFLLMGAMTLIRKRYKRSHTSPLTRDLLRPAAIPCRSRSKIRGSISSA